MGDLSVRVYAGIRSPSAVDSYRRSIDPFQRIFYFSLHRANRFPARAISLQLPPFEETPQIRNLELQPHVGDYRLPALSSV